MEFLSMVTAGRRSLKRACVLAVWLLGLGSSGAALAGVDWPEVEVLALFTDKAVLVIDGEQSVLEAGQTLPGGLTLQSADATAAVVAYRGETRRLGLSERIAAEFEPAAKPHVTIALNHRRAYVHPGSIEGRPVDFVVDTGANVVALSEVTAKRLGVEALEGRRDVVVETASGRTQGRRVILGEVHLGSLEVKRVPALILDGSFPRRPLLGMSFLRHVDMEHRRGVMILRQPP
jgi:aspartyl protease family protein